MNLNARMFSALSAQRARIFLGFLLVLGLLAMTSTGFAVAITSITPTWTDATGSSGAPSCINISNAGANAEVRFGDNDAIPNNPCPGPGSQSGLGFTSGTGGTYMDGTPFLLGELTHFNRQVVAPSLLTSATLNLALSSTAPVTPPIKTTVTLNETANNLTTCPYGDTQPCSDQVTITPAILQFTDAGTAYQIEVLGLIPGTASSCAFSDDALRLSLVSEEDSNNPACVFGRVTQITDAQLEITKSTPATVLVPGQIVEYQVDYSCASITASCRNVSLTDFLPAELQYINSTGSIHTVNPTGAYSPASNTVRFDFIDPLPAGSTGFVTIQARVINSGTIANGQIIANTATSIQTNGRSTTSTTETPAQTVSAWDVQKLGDSIAYISSEPPITDMHYTVQICPNGSNVNLLNAVMVDTLPPGSTFISAPGGTYTAPSTVSWTLGDLSATGGCVAREIVVQFANPPLPATPTFTAGQTVTNSVTGAGTVVGGDPWTDSATLDRVLQDFIPTPNVNLDKETTRADGDYVVGAEVDFSLRPRNTGNTNLYNLSLVDDLPDQIKVTQVRLGGSPYPIRLEYELDNSGTYAVWPGSPFPVGANSTLNVSALPGVTSANWVTSLRWTFNPGGFTPPAWALNPAAHIIGTITSPDRNGTILTADSPNIVNTATVHWEYLPGGNGTCTSPGAVCRDTTDSATVDIVTIPRPSFDKTSRGGAANGQRFIIGQQVGYFDLAINNDTGIALDNFRITDDIPAQFNVTSVNVGSYANWTGTIGLRYEASNSPGVWVNWGSFAEGATVNAPVLGAGVYISRIEFAYGTVPAGFSGAANIFGTTLTTDRNGSAVVDGSTMVNHARMDWDYQNVPSFREDTTSDTIRIPTVTPTSSKTVTSSGPYIPTSAVTYRLSVGAALNSPSNVMNNPIATDLLPANVNYVSYSYDANGTSMPAPVLQVIPNFQGTQTLLRWTFTGTLQRGQSVNINLNTTLAAGTQAGDLDNTMRVSVTDMPTNGGVPDSGDWDGVGGSTNSVVTSTARIAVAPLVGLDSSKGVRGQLDPAFTVFPDYGDTVPNGNVDYRLTVINRGNVPINNVRVVDILPGVGDTGVRDTRPRNSAWSPVLTSPVTPQPGVTVYYSTSSNPCRPEIISTGPAGCTTPNWSLVPPAPISSVRSLRFDFANTLAPGQAFAFQWRMRAPATATDGSVAWNSFAYTSTNALTGVPLFPAEPNKVGMRFIATTPPPLIDIEKFTSTGANPPDDADLPTGPFIGRDQPVTWTYVVTNIGGVPLENIAVTDDQGVIVACPQTTLAPTDSMTCTATEPANPARPLGQYANLGSVTGTSTIDGTIVTDEDPSHYFSYDPALARLGDYTWIDLNNNGQQESVEPPLGGVTMRLLDSSNNPVDDPNQGGVQDYVTTTDAAGLYNFVNLLPGTYRVQFDIPSIYSLTQANLGDDATDSDAVQVPSQPYGRTGDYVLAAGAVNNTVDAGFIARASLGDRIWLDTNGDGIQNATETQTMLVGGLRVDLMDSTGTNVVASTFTDLAGNYIFTDLLPGSYRVRFPVPPAGYLWTTKGAGSDTDSDVTPATRLTDVITLNAGENDPTWDAGLVAVASIGDFVWYDNNLNGRQDGGEPGVPNVTVRLLGSNGLQATRDNGTLIPDAQTDANGLYSFTNLRPGDYSVQFTRPSNTIFTAQNAAGTGFNASNTSDAIENGANIGRTAVTTLSPGENDTSWDAGLIRLASLGNFVWSDTNNNGQQNGGEPGVAGAVVTLLNAATGNPAIITDALGNIVNPITTPASGAYSFTNLDPRISYIVQFQRPADYVFATTNTGSDTTDSDAVPSGSLPLGIGRTGTITLTAGQNDTTIDAGLLQDASLGNFVWYDNNNNGIQDDGVNSGVPNVIVRLMATTTTRATDERGIDIPDQTTSAAGAYLFDHLRPGQYIVWFLPSSLPVGYTFARQDQGSGGTQDQLNSDPNRFTGRTATEALTPNEDNLNYDAGVVTEAALGNFVWEDLDADGQQDGGLEVRVANVTVTLLPATGNTAIDNPNTDAINDGYTTTTDANGFYSFVGLPPNETYRVRFGRPTGYIWTRPNNLGADDVNDSDGAFNTQVTAANATTGNITTLTPGSTDNTWDQGVLRPSRLGDRAWIDINDNGLLDSGESGLPGVTVRLLDSAGNTVDDPNTTGIQPYVLTTDANGNYQFFSLYPGQYIVQFDLPATSYIRSTYDVDGAAANTADSDAQIANGRTPVITLPYNTTDNAWDAGFVPLASIGNFVWRDANNDGIQNDGANSGINGVIVRLLNSDGSPVVLDALGATIPAVTTTTNASGNYSFTNLNPRLDYIVQFDLLPDFKRSPANVLSGGGTNANNSDASLTDGRTAIIPLNPGQNNVDIDAGFTPLARIGDYVWVDTNGNGQQDSGETGLNGVTVTLFDGTGTTQITTDGLGNPIAPILTVNNPVGGAPGYYQFSNLNAGTYQIEVTLPNGYIFTRHNVNPDTTDSDVDRFTGRTGNYTLGWGGSDQSADAGIVLPASLGDFVWYDANDNGQQDAVAAEAGVNGVVVRLLDTSDNPVDDPNTPAINDAYVLTTADNAGNPGWYLFQNLIPGDYRVQFDLPASTLPQPSNRYVLARQNQGNDASDSDPDRLTGITTTINLSAGENDLTNDAGILLRGARLGNRVWIDLNNNGIQDTGEAGLNGVTVSLLNGSGGTDIDPITPGTQALSTTTSNDPTLGDGWYQFTQLVPGTFIVEVTLPAGYQFSAQDVAAGGADGDSDVNISTGRTTIITISENADDQTWDAGLVPLASIGDRAWVDANDNGVQDGGETGLNGVTVRLLNSAGAAVDNPNLAGNQDYILTTANNPVGGAPGWYHFVNLPPDQQYRVEFVRPNGYLFSALDAGSPNDDAADSDANPADDRTIATTLIPAEDDLTWDAGFVPLASLGDYAWRDNNANGIQDSGDVPLAGVTVTLLNASTGLAVSTDGNGNAITPIVTTGTGLYSFTNLDPRLDYIVQFSLSAGFKRSPVDQGGNDALDSDAAIATGRSPVIDLAPGAANSTIDAGYAPLAALGDRIWNDGNGNGVQDGGELGLAGASVTLLDGSNNPVTTDGLGNPISPIVTTGTGAYLFSNLNAGTYRILVTPPSGYALTRPNVGADTADSDVDRFTGISSDYVLGWGETNITADAGAFQPARLGDTVWEDLNYNGQQNSGEPGVNGVTVRLLDNLGNPVDNPNTAAIDDAYIVATATNAGNPGYYQFSGLFPGDYIVEFVAPNGTEFTQPNINPDTSDSDALVASGRTGTYTLAANGSNQTADAGIFTRASLGDRVWVDLDNNGVQDSGELGYNGATVTLYTGAGVQVGSPTTTDSSGNYSFTNLLPGDYYVVVTLPGGFQFSPTGAGTPATDSDANISTGRMATTTLISGENDTAWDAGLVPLASIGDRVWNDADGNGAQDTGETGVGGVTVNLYRGGDATPYRTTTTSSTVGSEGAYLFDLLPPGDYFLEFVLPNGTIFTRPDNATDAADSDADRFTGRTIVTTLSPGQNDTSWDAGILQPAAIGDIVWEDVNDNGQQDEPPASGQNGITVRLLDSSGSPVDDPNTDGVQDYIVTTANDGAGNPGYYAFTGLFPGDYIVEFVPPSADWTFARQNLGDDTSDSDVIRATGRTAAVNLVAGETDSSVDAGLLQLASLGDRVWIDLDNDGVQDGGENGYQGATVTLYDGAGKQVATTTTGSDGAYLFEDLIPGDYYVVVTLPGGYQFSPTGVGTPASDSDADFTTGRMPTTTLISGESDLIWDAGLVPLASIGDKVWRDDNANGVQDGGEIGLPGVTVNLFSGGVNTPYRTTTTDSDGEYLFDLVPPGDYFVEFVLPVGYLATSQDAAAVTDDTDSDADTATGRTARTTLIPDEDDLTWDAGFVPLGSIGDRVWFDENGNRAQDPSEPGLSGVTVVLVWPNGVTFSDVTDSNGNYLFERLPPGLYTISVDLLTLPPLMYQSYDLVDPLDSSATYDLGPNENVRSVDFGYMIVPSATPTAIPTVTPPPVEPAGEPQLLTNDILGPICARECVPIVTYVSNINGNWDVYRLVEGGEDVNLTDNDANDTQMSYSPDGSYMVFVSDRDGNPEIYVQSLTGGPGTAQRVTYNSIAIESDPVWGPGNFIAYVSSRSGNFELYVFNVLTGTETRVTNNDASDLSPSWTPDGQLIYQSDISGQWQIYQVDVNSGATRLLSDGQGDDLDPIVSPDGSRLAYRSLRQVQGSDAEPNSVLFIANADGSAPVAISDLTTNAVNPTWSPDGSQLSYQSDVNGNLDVFAYNVGPGTTEQVSEGLMDDFAPIYRCDRDTVLFSSNSFSSATVFEDMPQNDQIAESPDEDSINYVAQSSVQVYLLGNQQKQFAGNEGVLPSGPDATGGQTTYTFPDLTILEDPLATENTQIPFDPFVVCEEGQ